MSIQRINKSLLWIIRFEHWASFIFQITYQSRIPIIYSLFICVLVPWTTIQPSPFQQLKVTIIGSLCTCLLHSMGIDLSCTISVILGDHSWQRVHMCPRPMDTHLTLPNSASQGHYSWQHSCMSIHPMGIDLLWPISAAQGDQSRQRGSMCLHPKGILKVTIDSSVWACRFNPWTLIRPAPF